MTEIKVNVSKPYTVTVGENLLSRLGGLLCEVVPRGKVLLFSDKTAFKLFGKLVVSSLENSGFCVVPFVFCGGEKSKRMKTVLKAANVLSAGGFTSLDCVLALGGGVTTDLAGLTAALYRRGIPFVNVPTTLLAMADASVGGKNGVDLKNGKNLLGTVYQPRAVFCDTSLVCSLPPRVFNEGTSEIIKCAFIGNKSLIDRFLDTRYNIEEASAVEEAVVASVRLKAALVERDEYDAGVRRLLNFGHTFAHAIERLSRYAVTHGEAVASGMVLATEFAEKRGFCGKEVLSALKTVLKRFSLPTDVKYTKEQIYQALLTDKKIRGDSLSLILPKELGECAVCEIGLSEFKEEYIYGRKNLPV